MHFVDADVIHMGDTYFNGFYSFIDFQHGGTMEGMIAIIEKVTAMAGPKTRIIPGHGPLSNRAELMKYRDMLAAVGGRITRAIVAGNSLEIVHAEKPTSEFDAEWGDGFLKPKKFVELVYTGTAN